MPKLIFLGTGTSTGVPQIGCKCEVCRSNDTRDKRLRTSALYIGDDGSHILIDCGPDFREQMLRQSCDSIDAVLLTHEHYDHVGGIDDLRPFSFEHSLPIFTNQLCADNLRQRLPYCFTKNKYPGVPNIELVTLDPKDSILLGNQTVQPIQVMHDLMPIYGYRIGKMAYITDMSHFVKNEDEKLKNLNVLIVNALRINPHHSHQSLDEALTFAKAIGARETYLIHMSHQIGLHRRINEILPPHVHLAYDGLQVEW